MRLKSTWTSWSRVILTCFPQLYLKSTLPCSDSPRWSLPLQPTGTELYWWQHPVPFTQMSVFLRKQAQFPAHTESPCLDTKSGTLSARICKIQVAVYAGPKSSCTQSTYSNNSHLVVIVLETLCGGACEALRTLSGAGADTLALGQVPQCLPLGSLSLDWCGFAEVSHMGGGWLGQGMHSN